jgi:surface antigen
MWKKKSLAIMTAALMGVGTVTPAFAQPYNNGPYGNSGNGGPGSGPDNDGQYDNGPYDPNGNDNQGDNAAPYNGQYDRYDNGQYNGRYGANPPPPPGPGAYDNPPPPPPAGYGPPPPPPGYGPPPPPNGAYGRDYDTAQDDSYRDCQQQRAGNQTGGLIIGAIAGGLLGNTITRGRGRGAGTALGAIAGGAIGASIGNNLSCEDRGYAYNSYYAGFEAGRPHQRYNWRSPQSGAYGYIDIGDYYRDRGGLRCANYTQRIWVHGRPELATGHACKQRSGAWVFVN